MDDILSKSTRNADAAPPSNIKAILDDLSGDEGNKASLFNLIVYIQESRRIAYFTEMVKTIRAQFPCRIVFVKVNPRSKENYFHVQTMTEGRGSDKTPSCDEIIIETAGQDVNRTFFLLYPLFVPDLPIYLLWGEDPTTEHSVLPHLEPFSNRLIFDAEATHDLQRFSLDLLDRVESSSLQFIDMSWARIHGWREVLAQVFDSKERLLQLANAGAIEIYYDKKQSELFIHPHTQAVYLQAWLASRLKWQFSRAERENGTQTLFYKSGERIRTIQLIGCDESHFGSGDISKVNVLGDNAYECHIQRVTSDQVRVQASNQFQCELPFVLLMPTLRSGRSFMQEIFYQKMSSHYLATLRIVSQNRWS